MIIDEGISDHRLVLTKNIQSLKKNRMKNYFCVYKNNLKRKKSEENKQLK